MASAISPIMPPVVAPAASGVAAPGKTAGSLGEFASMLSNAIGRVDQGNQASQDAADRYLSGENEEIHDMVIATQRSELQFELFLQVRNKVVQAYQEVMRMQM